MTQGKRLVAACMACGVIILLAGMAMAESPRLFIQNPRALGMGRAGVALPYDENVFFYNPALLSFIDKGMFTILDFRLSLNGNVLDQYDFYKNQKTDLENMDTLSEEEKEELYENALKLRDRRGRFMLQGPFPVNYVRPYIGIGFFDQGGLYLRIRKGASGIPLIELRSRGDLLFIASVSRGMSVPHRGYVSAGLSLKYLYRVTSSVSKAIPSLANDEVIEVFQGGSFGIDMGVAYRFPIHVTVGLGVYDLVSSKLKWKRKGLNPLESKVWWYDPISSDIQWVKAPGVQKAPDQEIDPSLRVGVAYEPDWVVGHVLGKFAFACDLDQPFDRAITFFSKLYFGAAMRLLPFPLRIRAGFAQGYPCVGIGVDTSYMRLEYAFYQEELGRYPGQIAQQGHLFRLKLKSSQLKALP